ncbi:MAG: histidinol-phosphate transaminase [Pseudomonadota bacterium]|nr:histidinol-phosphate transaminase [Pseudomonadota bacterium]
MTMIGAVKSAVAGSSQPRPRDALAAISPYQPGMTPDLARRRFGGVDFAKLSSNENPHGPSPRAIAAATAALGQAEFYPDSTSAALRGALSKHLGVDSNRIATGPGSEALIDYFFRAYLEHGDTLLLSRPTFPSYDIFALSAGARIVDVPRTATFDLDVGALTIALRQAPKALTLCTPNNPTGNQTSRRDIEAILAATPLSTLILFDEAYFEFQDEASALDLLEAWGGVFLLIRTFSKAYGLAGLRVGYGIASSPEVVAALDRPRPAFNIAGPSQAAAVAALADQVHLRAAVADIAGERGRIERALDAAGIVHTRSWANFVFVRCDAPLEQAFDRLLAAGLIVRPIPVRGEAWLRITVGKAADNDRLLAELVDAIR